jgi:hypothetical protein
MPSLVVEGERALRCRPTKCALHKPTTAYRSSGPARWSNSPGHWSSSVRTHNSTRSPHISEWGDEPRLYESSGRPASNHDHRTWDLSTSRSAP